MSTIDWERIAPAEAAYAAYRFNYEVTNPSDWKVAGRGSYPDRTLIREVELLYEGRIYHRVFSVVFEQDATTVQEVLFGDMLP